MKNFSRPGLDFDSDLYNNNSLEEFRKSISDRDASRESVESDKDKCVFCPKLKSFKETFLMLNKALYLKYSSSQNYYYTKEINDLVENEKKPHVINFKYKVNFEDEEENLTRYYNSTEFEYKLSYLTEYYKYHKEVPRMFMLPISNLMNCYHDKKRRIEYFKIKRMLNEQNKGVVTNNERNEPESTEEKKTSVYSDSEDKNGDMMALKMNQNTSKILALLDISSKNDISSQKQNQEEDKFVKPTFDKSKREVYEFFQKKSCKEKFEGDSITLDELNFYLNKIPSNDEKSHNLRNDESKASQIKSPCVNEANALEGNYLNVEINFDFSEVRPSSNNTYAKNNNENKVQMFEENQNHLKNSDPPCKKRDGSQSTTNEPKPQSIYSNLKTDSLTFFNKSELVKSCKASANPQQQESHEMNKPQNNLQKALKNIEQNTNTMNSSNSRNKTAVNQFFTFRDLTKNIQIFNRLIERQKSQMSKGKNETNLASQTTSKSHRNVNSIDFNNLRSGNIKVLSNSTPKESFQKTKTASLLNFQNFLHSNKEKLNAFIQNRLSNIQRSTELQKSIKAENAAKNSSSNSIKQALPGGSMNHRRIQSSGNGKGMNWNSAKQLPREKAVLKASVFQSAVQPKNPSHNDLFTENNVVFSPKPLLTTVSEYSPNKHVKHFKPISPTTIIPTSNTLFSLKERPTTGSSAKKPQPVGFRKLNLDDKVYVKKSRVKPKSFQLLQNKQVENGSDLFNDFNTKEPGNSKNTSISSKASGNLTANPPNDQSQKRGDKKPQKGQSSTSLKFQKHDDNENMTQKMKINIISNFFNFNNSETDKDNNPIVLKLKNEFSNMKMKPFPNYKFLDINLVSKSTDKEVLHSKSKKKGK